MELEAGLAPDLVPTGGVSFLCRLHPGKATNLPAPDMVPGGDVPGVEGRPVDEDEGNRGLMLGPMVSLVPQIGSPTMPMDAGRSPLGQLQVVAAGHAVAGLPIDAHPGEEHEGSCPVVEWLPSSEAVPEGRRVAPGACLPGEESPNSTGHDAA